MSEVEIALGLLLAPNAYGCQQPSFDATRRGGVSKGERIP